MKVAVTAHSRFTISEIDPRLYGSFIEHLGRAVYTGIYEPDHPTADANGMRQDVIDLVKELNVPVVRYPGGNFVSAYNWEDGIGPRASRPTRLDLAWHTSESNQVGIHEFAEWCKSANTEMMLAVNLGSRGLDEARNFLEYVNHPGGSEWSDKRRDNGRAEPFDVKLWCLGNEMDGPWQIGHKSADEYGRLAHETAKAMRAFDSSLELVVCGSSNAHMPTYPQWEATVLDHTYDEVDYISLHMYFENRAKNTANFLAKSVELDNYIGTVAGVIEYIKAKKRSTKNVYISFDEWNVWYHSKERDKAILEGASGWPHAPALLEDDYNFEDVLQVVCILNTFINRADVVKIACLAQLVNVIAPIMTVPGGPAWRQTIYYPYYFASVYGRGTALKLIVDSPTYAADGLGDIPYLDISAVHDDTSRTITFFIVNRHQQEALDLGIALLEFGTLTVIDDQEIAHPDLAITNTAGKPDNVVPRKAAGASVSDGALSASIAPLSYRMIRLQA
ncbi:MULTISPECIES: alpha-N-arabinofuranosidase [Rhizobium]|uniref:non-reducing end alpha-L-arabinofuranosidase n=1 Tax=Rhizobium rhododendri TaxID=2506430 RepID=A0ABY8IVX1_9HYPH|nr:MULTISPECIES: alpha-N-arabinofuranosidase [Rhizobium]MBZ5759314.1 alpha-N-arabinofuranosidase [Rhizobium sp. VS19-DR96]MBZ5765953.1 alpha-N-arabinofuranosidase [Rhizobium sp. VS19-DR129.2]MBZ5774037.1 alpha-N-arabinofuranosidase [Rhizobium sp. VS19-DRK62.2]MBZ5785109.1 alpha-N-arabinofuranosidase [Rhizobium sp. VS19-DR121]MBZ5801814.1 alpha-N-arabinofuranosidase [Rhizobium sp. VS19-DR181]